MELDDKAKLASRRLGDAVNAAARESEAVREAIGVLREMGFDTKLSFHLDLIPLESSTDPDAEEIAEDFTDNDRKELGRMLIRVR